MTQTETKTDVVRTIAAALGEWNWDGIYAIVRVIGEQEALAYLDKALAIQANGGQMTSKGGRKRTPGGVFFHLVRTQSPKDVRDEMLLTHYARKMAKKNQEPKQEPKQEPAPTPIVSIVPKNIALDTKGEKTTVKITLVGRPATEVVGKEGHVQFVMKSIRRPTFPKGLPAPADVKQYYVCYIANKQWQKVAQAIANDPEDELVIEGFPQGNAANGSIRVFVTSAITKKSQRKGRAAAAEASVAE